MPIDLEIPDNLLKDSMRNDVAGKRKNSLRY